jgi:four helix bundle protein
MKIERFEDIKAWQEARQLVKMVYNAIDTNKTFQDDLRFKSQISSAAVSVMSNIAEGFSRNSNKEFIRFLFIAKGSIAELQSQLYVAVDLDYIKKEFQEEIYKQADLTAKYISKFITYLKDHIK